MRNDWVIRCANAQVRKPQYIKPPTPPAAARLIQVFKSMRRLLVRRHMKRMAMLALAYFAVLLQFVMELNGQTNRMKSAPLTHPSFKALRAAALAYPDTVEDFPWGHPAYKVAGKKAFLFMGVDENGALSLSMKLPFRAEEALRLRYAKPTEYGLGRSGWVTFTFAAKSKAPIPKLLDYLDESWRAVAPKKLAAAHPAPKAKRPG